MKRLAPFGLALLALVGCKRCGDDSPTPAHAVEVEASAPTGIDPSPQLTGDLRGPTFVVQLAVYHFAAPPAALDATVRAALAKGGFEVLNALPEGGPPTKPVAMIAHPKVSEYVPPDLEALKYRGKALSDEEKVRLQKPAAVTLIDFAGPGATATKSYRAALDVMVALEAAAPGILWDESARVAMGNSALGKRLDDWVGDVPPVWRQISIDAYRDGELLRMVTLGMERFALPDVVVENLTGHDATAMSNVVNLVCQSLVEHATLPRPNQLDVAIATLASPAVRDYYTKDRLGGATGTATIDFHVTTPAKGDPDNRLVAIVFPDAKPTVQSAHVALIKKLFGTEEKIVHRENDPELLAASATARKKALALKPRFAGGPPQLEHLLVKGPFKTSAGGTEWMWIEVVSWKGTTIEGILQNEPFDVPSLKAGARVQVEESAIFDYIWNRADGSVEGNETQTMLGE